MSEENFNYDQAKFVDGYDNYLLFANGNILNLDTNKWLKQTKDKGYVRVGLRKNNKTKMFMLHQLLAQAFIPNSENKPFIDHINHIKDDNRINNLRWVSSSENQKNHSLSSLNSSGFRGVSYNKRYNNWYARWCDGITGKLKSKSFSISKYGAEQSLKNAVIWRYQMEQEHNYTLLQTPEQFFNSDEFKQVIEDYN